MEFNIGQIKANSDAYRNWANNNIKNGNANTKMVLVDQSTQVNQAKEGNAISHSVKVYNGPNAPAVDRLIENNTSKDSTSVKQANTFSRSQFLSFIKQACGLQDNASLDQLPTNVQEAMKLTGSIFHRRPGDWAEGTTRPLTARRVSAIMVELDKYTQKQEGMAFHPSSLYAQKFLKTWGNRVSFQGTTRALLNNIPLETLNKLAEPLVWLGSSPDKKPVLLILKNKTEIESLIDQKKLTPSALFKIMYPDAKVPEVLQKKGATPKEIEKAFDDRKALDNASMMDTTLTKTQLNMVQSQDRLSSERTPDILDRIEKLFDREGNLTCDPNAVFQRDPVFDQYNAPVTSTNGTAGNLVTSLKRQTKNNNEMSITFIDRTNENSKPVQVVFKQVGKTKDKEGQEVDEKPQNSEAEQFLDNQVKQLCGNGNYNTGMLYSSMSSDDGINRVIRDLSWAKTGNTAAKGIEGGNYTVEKLDNDILRVTLSSRENSICQSSKGEFYKVDYKMSVLLYPDGSQKEEKEGTKSNYEKLDNTNKDIVPNLGELKAPENCDKFEFKL